MLILTYIARQSDGLLLVRASAFAVHIAVDRAQICAGLIVLGAGCFDGRLRGGRQPGRAEEAGGLLFLCLLTRLCGLLDTLRCVLADVCLVCVLLG